MKSSPPCASTRPAPRTSPSVAAQGEMWVRLAANMARQLPVATCQLSGREASSCSGGRTLGSSLVHARMLRGVCQREGGEGRAAGWPDNATSCHRVPPAPSSPLHLFPPCPPSQPGKAVLRLILSRLEGQLRQARRKVRHVLHRPNGRVQQTPESGTRHSSWLGAEGWNAPVGVLMVRGFANLQTGRRQAPSAPSVFDLMPVPRCKQEATVVALRKTASRRRLACPVPLATSRKSPLGTADPRKSFSAARIGSLFLQSNSEDGGGQASSGDDGGSSQGVPRSACR